MTTMQTTQQSLAALLEAAPPELREVLTRPCSWCFGGESVDGVSVCHRCNGRKIESAPVPEATLAAQEWWLHGRTERGIITLYWGGVLVVANDPKASGIGPDIFAAIRAALGGE